MPSNYSGVIETQEPVDVGSKYEVDTETDANMILRAGKSVANLFEGMQKGKNEEAIGEISGQIADVEAGVVQYNDALAEITAMTLSTDENVRNQASAELQKLRAGQKQGSISPSAARLRTNQIIKQYSVAYPHLSKDIRSMANASMDNYSAIRKEVFGDDPVNAAAVKLQEDAVINGTTPYVMMSLNRAKEQEKETAREATLLATTQGLNKDNSVALVQKGSFAQAQVDTHNLAMSWYNTLNSGGTLSEADAINQISALKDTYLRNYQGQMVGVPGVKQEDIKNALAPAFNLIDNLETIFKSTGTIDQKTKLAKMVSELNASEKDAKTAAAQAQVGGLLSMLPPGTFLDVVTQGVIASNSRFDINDSALDDIANNALQGGDMTAKLGLQLARTAEGQKIIGEVTAQLLSGIPLGQVDQVTGAIAKRNVDKVVGGLKDPLQRQQVVANAIGNFTWNDIINNKNVAREVAQNPALMQDAMEKAAAYAADIVVGKVDPKDIVVDHDPSNPVKIKGQPITNARNSFVGRQPLSHEIAAMQPSDRLDYMYRDIINTFGAAGIDLWVKSLGLDARSKPKDTRNPDGTPKKKVTKTEEGGDIMGTIHNINSQSFGLPEAVVEAFAGQESDGGRNYAKDAGAGARGPLQITEGTFKLMNDKFYGGKLNFDDEQHQIIASLTLLKNLYTRHNGNISLMAMEYYSGTTNPNRRPKAGVPGPSAGGYAEQVTKRYNAAQS